MKPPGNFRCGVAVCVLVKDMMYEYRRAGGYYGRCIGVMLKVGDAMRPEVANLPSPSSVGMVHRGRAN